LDRHTPQSFVFKNLHIFAKYLFKINQVQKVFGLQIINDIFHARIRFWLILCWRSCQNVWECV